MADSRFARAVPIAAILTAYFVLRLYGIGEGVVNRNFDEGVHLTLMKLIARDHLHIYRDTAFIHPPGVIWLGAAIWNPLHGDVGLIRAAYVLVCSLLLLPVYAIANRLYGRRVALCSLLLIAVTPGFCGWLGRDIYLEPILMLAVTLALWALVRLPGVAGCVLAGLTLGCSFLLKETAMIAGASVCAAAFLSIRSGGWVKPIRRLIDPLLLTVVFAASTAVVLYGLSRIPGYWRDTVLFNVMDPFSIQSRRHEIEHGFYQLAVPLTIGMYGVLRMTRDERREARLLGWFSLICFVAMTVLAKRFFWRHWIYVMPVASIAAAALLFGEPKPALASGERKPAWESPRVRAFTLLMAAVQTVTLVLYFGHERLPPPAFATAVATLRRQPDPVFTFDPIWVLAAGRSFPHWEFASDPTLIQRKYGTVKPADVHAVLAECRSALIDRKTWQLLDNGTKAIVAKDFTVVFQHGKPSDGDYVVVYRRRLSPPGAAKLSLRPLP